MQINLIAVGERMPGWVQQGFDEYAKRLPPECGLRLIEVAAGKRGKNADIARIRRGESERLLTAVPKSARILALEVDGKSWSTEQLAKQLERWMAEGQDVALLIGGPDGLTEQVRTAAQQQWSLSSLTLPHPLVRVIVAEQLYRAWSILHNHPYHRA